MADVQMASLGYLQLSQLVDGDRSEAMEVTEEEQLGGNTPPLARSPCRWFHASLDLEDDRLLKSLGLHH